VIRIGRTQDLTVLRRTSKGLLLGDDDHLEALLPASEHSGKESEGSTLRVFVYPNDNGQLLATTQPPKFQVGEFASLRVASVTAAGAYLDWGLATGLVVPHEEQRNKLVEGRWYIVRLALNEQSGQLYASTRIDDFMDNSALTVQRGDKVQLLVFSRSELGLSVIVNDKHQGLVHANELFKPVSIGDRVTGYIKTVREDNKLDITLQPIGYRQFNNANTALLAKRLQERNGHLRLNDKSAPEEIYAELGISKKAFKQALGALYKDRRVRIEEEGITWIG
jgi:uncharacterized protein